MLKVGITGGIGSGKSTVCQVFATLGIPVFNADEAAKYLSEHDERLVTEIKKLFGEQVYVNGSMDRAQVSDIVFKEPARLQQLNALIHPAVIHYADEWMNAQKSLYTIKEAAIFFESGSYKSMDIMIGVSSPLELRIQRSMARSVITRSEVMARMSQQMNEEEKMSRCDYVIINDERTAIIPQVLQLHEQLLLKAKG